MNERLLKVIVLFFSFIVFSLNIFAIYKIISTVAPDFSVLWLGAKDFSLNKNPYLNPNLFTGIGYPPNTLLFYIPLVYFAYNFAQALFIFLSVMAVMGSVYLTIKIVTGKVSLLIFLFGLSLTFLSFPTKFTFGMGQNNSIALLLLLVAYNYYVQRKLLIAGVLIGSVIAFKTIFIFFLLFFLVKREWKMISYAVLTIVVSIFLTLLISNASLYVYYLKEIIPALLNLSGREVYYNQGIMGFVARLTDDLALRKNVSLFISVVLISMISVISTRKNKKNLHFSLFIIVFLLIDTLSWQHHFLWLVFPFVLLTSYAIKMKNIYSLFLIGISYILVSWNFKNPSLFFGFPQVLVISNTFYGTVILFFINILFLLRDKLRE